MEYRTVGRSDLSVSVVGVGTNNFGMRADIDAEPIVRKALDLGINLFDTAARYGDGKSEAALGEALGTRRRDAVIATKWGPGSPDMPIGSRRYILQSIERSLRLLKTDYIDLYQLHRTCKTTPVEETLRALEDLIKQGKVRYIGVCNTPAWQAAEWYFRARENNLTRIISCQEEYSLIQRRSVEPELLPAMQRFGLGLLPYFPLASGLLTGKYRRGEAPPPGSRFAVMKGAAQMHGNETQFELTQRLTDFAQSRGHTILELAMSWLAGRPAVASIIAGATSPAQVEANAAATLSWRLTPEEADQVDRITLGT